MSDALLPVRIRAKAEFQRPPTDFSMFREVDLIIKTALNEFGSEVLAWIQQRAPRDTEQLSSSLEVEVRVDEKGLYTMEVFSAVPYAVAALETGRRPGKAPPPDKLLGWIVRHQFTDKQLETVRMFAGRRAGAAFRARRAPGKLKGKFGSVGEATSYYSMTTRLEVNQTFLAGEEIARRGIPGRKLFTKAGAANADKWKATQDKMMRQIMQAMSGKK